jgi:hypothetical protein
MADDFAGSNLAATQVCRSGNCPGPGCQITRGMIHFDTSKPWYTGVGDAPATKYDLWSVSTHEFGHVTGFGMNEAPDHFTGTICPEQTMCGAASFGSENQRTLDTHDIHTFQGAYLDF